MVNIKKEEKEKIKVLCFELTADFLRKYSQVRLYKHFKISNEKPSETCWLRQLLVFIHNKENTSGSVPASIHTCGTQLIQK